MALPKLHDDRKVSRPGIRIIERMAGFILLKEISLLKLAMNE